MTSSPIASIKVNSMATTDPLQARARREIVIFRAAPSFASQLAILAGEPERGLNTLSSEDRDRFREALGRLIDVYLTAAQSKPEPEPVTRTRESMSLIARQKGRDAARDRGHEMGPYRMAVEDGGRDESACAHCGRSVFIDITKAPAFSGPAVDEGCIAEAL